MTWPKSVLLGGVAFVKSEASLLYMVDSLINTHKWVLNISIMLECLCTIFLQIGIRVSMLAVNLLEDLSNVK